MIGLDGRGAPLPPTPKRVIPSGQPWGRLVGTVGRDGALPLDCTARVM